MSTAKMYFLAVVAPAQINEQVLKWKHYMREHYGCVVALKSPAHITLVPPFWMDESLEKKLMSSIDEFAVTRNKFDIQLKNFDAFKPKVIFVGVEENDKLLQLKLDLDKKEARPFHPHLTIANRDLRKKDFAPAFEHFSKIEYHASFTVNDIALLKHNGTEWQIHHCSPLSEII